ncbi:hypothetical protein MLD38_025911 [Melastoma candidum]|uniref:Uncharacterized protein n=1 Tax=Melastoma candidum TaxID=119954 RepID=A0ACB9NXU5_9MYRT|nr:hypothetical protein MLD38_025911 [Melastoma candidum]
MIRIPTLHRQISEKKNRKVISQLRDDKEKERLKAAPGKQEARVPSPSWSSPGSNTTGDFALETFTVNLTSRDGKSEYRHAENVMFGCGHRNRGLFQGAAGLLGLGRGALSFSSQLQSLYSHSFTYCLVDRNSDSSVRSKLNFGEDKDLLSHPNMNFMSFVEGKENPVETFYYIQVKSILVGGVDLKIPEETWKLGSDCSGGTIIDSGTTLSYFAEPAYSIIREAFLGQIKSYPLIKDIEILNQCYNISGIENVELPEFTILFADGAVWDFPAENYFITLIPNELVCLPVLGTPLSALSIIGNYQQQNFHVLYETKRSCSPIERTTSEIFGKGLTGIELWSPVRRCTILLK